MNPTGRCQQSPTLTTQQGVVPTRPLPSLGPHHDSLLRGGGVGHRLRQAFDKCFEGSIVTEVDETMGMRRVEIMCGNCGGHLGHVFENERGPGTERHCGASVPRLTLARTRCVALVGTQRGPLIDAVYAHTVSPPPGLADATCVGGVELSCDAPLPRSQLRLREVRGQAGACGLDGGAGGVKRCWGLGRSRPGPKRVGVCECTHSQAKLYASADRPLPLHRCIAHGVVSSTLRMSAGLYLMLLSVLLSESRYTMNFTVPFTSTSCAYTAGVLRAVR